MKSFFNKTLIGVLALSVVGVGFIIRKKKISCNKNKKSNSVKVSDVTGDSLPSKKINYDDLYDDLEIKFDELATKIKNSKIKEYNTGIFEDVKFDDTKIKEYDFDDFEDVKEFLGKGNSLGRIPVEKRTKKICEYAFSLCSSNYHYIPIEFVTRNMVFEYLKLHLSFGEVPSVFIDKKMIKDLIIIEEKMNSLVPWKIQSGKNEIFKNIPITLWDKELSTIAIEHGNENYIPFEQWDEELCKIALKQNPPALRFILDKSFFDKRLLTEDHYISYIKDNGVRESDICNLPETLLTTNLIQESISKNPNILKYFLKDPHVSNLLTKEMIEKAVILNGNLITHLPYEKRSQDLFLKALKSRPDSKIIFKNIPQEFLNDEIYIVALINSNCSVEKIPKEILTEEFLYKYLQTLPKHRDCFSETQAFPKELMSKRIFEFILKKGEIFNLAEFPREWLTQEMCNSYVDEVKNKWNFSLILLPKEFITEEICLKVIKKQEKEFVSIPEKYLNKEFIEKVLLNNSKCLEFIPEKFKTVEVCRKISANNKSILKYIPDNILKEIAR